jgi:hypothetical protein
LTLEQELDDRLNPAMPRKRDVESMMTGGGAAGLQRYLGEHQN